MAEIKENKKLEMFKKDIVKAMDLIAKANVSLDKARGRLPKRTPKVVPVGSSLFADYGQVTVQDVLDDINKVDEGVNQSVLDTLNKLIDLVGGEAGFEF